MNPGAAERLYISPVAFRCQVNITHPGIIGPPDIGMGSPILRIPEFVRCGPKRRPPGYAAWEVIRPDTELRYHWAAPAALKREYGTDFCGRLRVQGPSVLFEVTYKNIAENPASEGVSLFCLQAGTMREFHDYEGVNTFVWATGRFVSINEMIRGEFNQHRMAGAGYVPDDPAPGHTTRKLMAKRSDPPGFVLGIATDPCSGVGGNFNIWPSCIHSNPAWSPLEPGAEATARGRVYFMRGTLEDLLGCYIRDFEG